MGTRPLKQITGDAAIEHNATIGGGATVRGDAKVCHDLRVDGWLDAPNIKGACKGLFATEGGLKERYPHPRAGWWALVGNDLPAQLYTAAGGDWEAKLDTEGNPVLTGNPTLEDTERKRRIAELEEEISDLKSEIRRLTPVRCEDEADLAAKIASGDYAEDQMYYIEET